MLKNQRSGPELSKAPILFAACLVFTFFLASMLVYKNNHFLEKSSVVQLSNSFVRGEMDRSLIHDGFFFRRLAERFVYYPHDPLLVIESYKLSVIKSPAEHRNFLSYAEYFESRGCCTELAVQLMKEAARRAPSEPDVQRRVGAYLFLNGAEQESISYIRNLFDLNPVLMKGLYQYLVRHNVPMSQLIVITPFETEALIELAEFFASNREKAKVELRRVVDALLVMPIAPAQRLDLARQAFHAGEIRLAEREALNVLRSSDSHGQTLELLFDIYWSEKDYDRFEKTARRLEQVQLDSGKQDAAARIAVVVADRLSRIEDRSKTFERLTRVAKTYPEYTAVYLLLANFYRGESDERVLYYLQKAVQLEPDNSYYSETLAEHYLKLSRVDEALQVYERFLRNPKLEESGYLGIASCKERKGQLQEAVAALMEGIEKNGRSERLFLGLGGLYDRMGEYENAAQAYEQYSNLTSKKIHGLNLAAAAYKNAGNYDAAIKKYEKVLSIDPKNRQAMEGLAFIKEINE